MAEAVTMRPVYKQDLENYANTIMGAQRAQTELVLAAIARVQDDVKALRKSVTEDVKGIRKQMTDFEKRLARLERAS